VKNFLDLIKKCKSKSITGTHPPSPSLQKRRGEMISKSLSFQERDLG